MTDLTDRLAATLSDRYTIERELGAGGMATVYLARDRKHGRQVALKVLRPEFAAAIGGERFLKEIRVTAQLDHPHILTLIDSGEAGGLLYYVLPYVRGDSLRQRLTRQPQLPIDVALRITRDVARALEFAHREGIVHRDVKPENIMLQADEAMLMDFGIALAVDDAAMSRLTGTGVWLGTPAYMSPEQSLGERDLDPQSDQYSLATVLYEMLAGECPYTAPNGQALIAKRLVDPVPSVRRIRATVPTAVDRALLRALATAPADRFDSISAFAEALVATDEPRAAPGAIAVLPFISLSAEPDNEYFADGITEDVIAHLSKVRALSVISRASVMPFKKRQAGLREIAAQLHATAVLDGSVRRAGERVRIVAQLIDPMTDRNLWTDTYDRQLTDIFAIQTDVALRIAHTLEARLSHDEEHRIGKAPTADIQAYNLNLQGRQLFSRYTQDGMLRSISYFEQAIDRDPRYAPAHVGIALAWTELGESGFAVPEDAYRKAKATAHRAIELDDDLGDAHCALAYVRVLADFDWAGAEREFRRALELNPGSADTHDLYGRMCAAQQRYDEAEALTRRAQELDPLTHRTDLGNVLLRAGRNEEALQAMLHAIDFDPGYDRAHATLGWAYFKSGNVAEGIAQLRHALDLSPGNSQWLAQLGEAYGLSGATDEARKVLAQLEDRARTGYVSPYHIAFVHIGLGDHDRAIDILERAIDARAGAAYGISGSFLVAPLRSHPRFSALLRKLKLD
ncbi:MAG: protein kinase domain-containing protein [Gemmatimonadales bacterium]